MKKTTLTIALLVAAFGALPEAAAQKKNPLEGAPSIRGRLDMRRLRFEVTPQFVFSVSQDFRHFLGGGAVLQFYFLDWLGVAVNVAGGGAIDSGLTANIDAQLRGDRDTTPGPAFRPPKEQFRAHLASTNFLVGAQATVIPFSGKLAMFGAAYLRYDLYGFAGVAVQNLTNGWGSYQPPGAAPSPIECRNINQNTDPNLCDPLNSGIKFGGNIGIGTHLYFNEWLGLNLELRDLINSTNPAGLDVSGDRKITDIDETIQNNLFIGFGVTFLLPLKPKVAN